jgi:coenzyme PQQ precursor peptide PqqA
VPNEPEVPEEASGRLRCTAIYDNLMAIGNIALTTQGAGHMNWETPKIEEISCSCEINSYSNGDF